MSKENPTSFQRKAKKGRYSDNYPLFFQTIFFLFLINCLSVALTSTIEIVIQIETGEEQQFLNEGFEPVPDNVKIDGTFELVAREEGLTNGVNNMLEVITNFNKGKNIVLSYAKSAKHAELLEHKLHRQYGEKVKIETRFLEPMLITQFGLGAVIVSFDEQK